MSMMSSSGHDLERNVFVLLLAGDAGFPRVRQAVERIQQALEQGTAIRVVVDDLLPDVVETDTLDVVHRAVEVPRFLAIELQEGAGIFLDLIGGLDLDEELRDFGLDAAVAADIEFPAAVDRDHANVLDACF